MRTVQLEEVEVGAGRHLRRGNELVADMVHVVPIHLARVLADR